MLNNKLPGTPFIRAKSATDMSTVQSTTNKTETNGTNTGPTITADTMKNTKNNQTITAFQSPLTPSHSPATPAIHKFNAGNSTLNSVQLAQMNGGLTKVSSASTLANLSDVEDDEDTTYHQQPNNDQSLPDFASDAKSNDPMLNESIDNTDIIINDDRD